MSDSHDDKTPQYDLVIQGAGPAGCVAALLAQRCGLSVALIDKQTQSTFRGNAHFLNGYTLSLLAYCGVDMSELLDLASPSSYAFSMSYGITLSSIYEVVNLMDDPTFKQKYESVGLYGAAANIPFSRIYPKLMDLIKAANIPIFWQSEVKQLCLEAHSLTVTQPDRVDQWKVTYLIGADGTQSGIRALCFPKVKPTFHEHFINIELRSDLTHVVKQPTMLTWLLNPAYPGCLVMHEVKGEQNLQVPVFVDDPECYVNDQQWVQHYVRKVFGQDVAFEIKRIQPWTVTSFCCETLSHDWVYLIGDSAHTLTPAGGMGLNMAMADAANLVWKLANASQLNNHKIIDSYQLERYPIDAASVKQSVENFADFRQMAQQVLIPVGVSSPWKNVLRRLPSSAQGQINNTLLGGYEQLMNMLFKVPLSEGWLKKRLARALDTTLQHFDGTGSHLGFTLASELVIEDDVEISHAVADYQPRCAAGTLWLDRSVTIINSQQPLLSQFVYGRWMALIFENNQETEAALSMKPNLTLYFSAIDFNTTTDEVSYPQLLLIRPDQVIAYSGDIERSNQLDKLLTFID